MDPALLARPKRAPGVVEADRKAHGVHWDALLGVLSPSVSRLYEQASRSRAVHHPARGHAVHEHGRRRVLLRHLDGAVFGGDQRRAQHPLGPAARPLPRRFTSSRGHVRHAGGRLLERTLRQRAHGAVGRVHGPRRDLRVRLDHQVALDAPPPPPGGAPPPAARRLRPDVDEVDMDLVDLPRPPSVSSSLSSGETSWFDDGVGADDGDADDSAADAPSPFADALSLMLEEDAAPTAWAFAVSDAAADDLYDAEDDPDRALDLALHAPPPAAA
mmetsp:Transcript_21678/g.73453  ORF Transcript_21678/g.73453 Transcript_21678/m.73453 type:complete len:272 (-) Transcript_21678:150-965(-)